MKTFLSAVDSSEREPSSDSGKEWRGGRRERREGERRDSRQEKEREGERGRDGGGRERERDRERGKEKEGRRRANPPSESAWSRGKPRSLGSKEREGEKEEKRDPPLRRYEEPPQPVSLLAQALHLSSTSSLPPSLQTFSQPSRYAMLEDMGEEGGRPATEENKEIEN